MSEQNGAIETFRNWKLDLEIFNINKYKVYTVYLVWNYKQ